MSDAFGKQRSVFGGAARAYMPGFDRYADPFAHQLFLSNNLDNIEGAERCLQRMRELAARDSVRREKLGRQVLAFSAIKNADLQLTQHVSQRKGASDSEQLHNAMERIDALKSECDKLRDEHEYYLTEYEKESERAVHAERQNRASAFHIQQLREKLCAKGEEPDQGDTLPTNWSKLCDWCDQKLAGRLAISAVARRNAKNPQFEDFEQVTRCLLWLANECRNARISGAGGSLRDALVEDSVRNSPCGQDAYDFDWQGRRLAADWHIKNGGNTRDPARCLRIYYCFDDETQQIVVSDMHAHRRTGAT